MNARRLRRALQLKQLLEKVRVAELADAERELSIATQEAEAAQRDHERRIHELSAPTEVSSVELSERARFVTLAKDGLLLRRDVEKERFVHKEHRLSAMHVATREVKTLERLHEKSRAEAQTVLRRAEQEQLDEHGQRKRGEP